jgi:ABC-type nitrate/sulfonate/bicarbonate transport system substrate-binding protein
MGILSVNSATSMRRTRNDTRQAAGIDDCLGGEFGEVVRTGLVPRSAKNIQKVNRGGALRLGFVPLIDAAPLIAAAELGYFADEGLQVSLERQIGWANVRDKLAFGHLDASHALLGLPLAGILNPESHGEELVSLMSLSSGGNAITLSMELTKAGVNSSASLARWIRDPHRESVPVIAHVFSSSMHHYLLRDWLDAAGINPDLDVRLCVIPPPQMPQHLADGHLDGFIVGEPWNTVAARQGCGSVVCPTTDIVPEHPEKVLATTRRWADDNANVLTPLIRAILRGCSYCADVHNVGSLSEMLARPRYIGVSADVLAASLSLDRSFGLNPRFLSVRPADWTMRSFSLDHTFPSRTHVAWLLEQMVRWGHAPCDVNAIEIADRCTDSQPYRRAAESLHIACPIDEYPTMPLRGGRIFDARMQLPTPVSA